MGSELCEVKAWVGLPAVAELMSTVEFQIHIIVQLFSSSSIDVVFHLIKFPKLFKP